MRKSSETIVLEKLGKGLRNIRKLKGLSVRELASISGIDNSKISKIERGKVNITYTTLVRLAMSLEIHSSMFLDFDFTGL